MHHEKDSPPNLGCRQFPGWILVYDVGRGQTQTYFHDKMGNSTAHEHLQTSQRRYKVKK